MSIKCPYCKETIDHVREFNEAGDQRLATIRKTIVGNNRLEGYEPEDKKNWDYVGSYFECVSCDQEIAETAKEIVEMWRDDE